MRSIGLRLGAIPEIIGIRCTRSATRSKLTSAALLFSAVAVPIVTIVAPAGCMAAEAYSDVPVIEVRKPDVLVVEATVAGRALPLPVKASFLAFLEPKRDKVLAVQADGSSKTEEFTDALHPEQEVAFAGMQLLVGSLKKHDDGRVHIGFTLLPAVGDGATVRGIVSVSAADTGQATTSDACLQEMLLSCGFACYDRREGPAPAPWHDRFEAAQESAKLQMHGCWKSDVEAMAELAERCADSKAGER